MCRAPICHHAPFSLQPWPRCCFHRCTWGVAERPQRAESWVTVNLTRQRAPHALVSLEGCVCSPAAAEQAGCAPAAGGPAAPTPRKRLGSWAGNRGPGAQPGGHAACCLPAGTFPLPSALSCAPGTRILAWDSLMGCRRQPCPSPRHGPSQASLGRGPGHVAAEPACLSRGRRSRWSSPSAGLWSSAHVPEAAAPGHCSVAQRTLKHCKHNHKFLFRSDLSLI